MEPTMALQDHREYFSFFVTVAFLFRDGVVRNQSTNTSSGLDLASKVIARARGR